MMHEIDILNLASALADHAGRRQTLIAQNVAHADTPGYQARDLTPFGEVYGEADFFPAAATRPGHMGFGSDLPPPVEAKTITAIGAPSPNGNTVSLEDQMRRAAQTKLDHDVALGVWRSAMNILRAAGSGGAGR